MRFAAALLALSTCAVSALDLTPQEDTKLLEGVKIPQLRFADGQRSATWQPPKDWRMRFDAGRLTFLPKDLSYAAFELRVVPRAAGDLDALSKAENLPGFAAGYLPKAATAITLTGGNEGPFTINAVSAREFLFDFQETGRASKASLSVVDLNERERLVIVITALPKDFADVRATAVQSMFSWHGE